MQMRIRVGVLELFVFAIAIRNCFVFISSCLFVFGSVEQFCLTDKCDAAVEVEVEAEAEVEAVARCNCNCNCTSKKCEPFRGF